MPDEEPLYVGVYDPINLRKDVLNSSKTVLSALQKYEKLISIKEEKAGLMVDLARTIRDIQSLNKRLRQMMPKTRVKPMVMKKGEEEEPKVVKKVGIVPESAVERSIHEKTRLAELEDELASVEEKLGGLE